MADEIRKVTFKNPMQGFGKSPKTYGAGCNPKDKEEFEKDIPVSMKTH